MLAISLSLALHGNPLREGVLKTKDKSFTQGPKIALPEALEAMRRLKRMEILQSTGELEVAGLEQKIRMLITGDKNALQATATVHGTSEHWEHSASSEDKGVREGRQDDVLGRKARYGVGRRKRGLGLCQQECFRHLEWWTQRTMKVPRRKRVI